MKWAQWAQWAQWARCPLAAGLLVASTLGGTARAQDDSVRAEPELDVDERILIGAVGEQTAANLAFDGSTYLVTWRSALWRNELRVSRLDATGALLDTRGIRLDGLERSDGAAAAAALPAPGGFLVAWTRSDSKVAVARIAAKGPLVVGPPVIVDQGDTEAPTSSPALVAVANGTVVAWSRGGANPGIFVRALPAADPASGPPAVRIAATAGTFALLGRGTTALAGVVIVFAVAAPGQTTAVHVARLDDKGAVVGPGPAAVMTLAGEQPGALAVAEGGGQLAIAAAAMKGAGFSEARLLQLDPLSLLPRPAPSLALPVGAAETAGGPTLAWDGGGFTALWAAQLTPAAATVAGVRLVGDALTPLPPAALSGSAFAGDARLPALMAAPQGLVAVWDRITWRSAGAVADADVMFARLGADLRPAMAPVLVSQGTNAEGEPVVAKSPRRLLVAFEDHRQDRTGSDIFAAPLTLEGTRTGAAPTAIATGPSRQTAPAVAWDGANFVVAWYEGERGLFASRLTEEGALVDPAPVAIKQTAALTFLSEPVLCADGDGSLMVYSARRTSLMEAPRTTELRALRIPRGQPADRGADVLLTTTSDTDVAPSLRMACNDKAALLAFTGVLAPGDPPRLMLARLERGQTTVARVPGIYRLPHRLTAEWAGVGTDGEGFMVNWRAPNRMGQRVVWATRLDGEGYLLDDAPWSIGGANSGRRVSTTWDGQQYVVLSVDTDGVEPFDLVGRRVARSGALHEVNWFKVTRLTTAFAGAGLGADAVAVAPGRLFVTYEQYADDDAAGNPRVRGRVLVTPKGSPIDAAPVEPSFRDGGPRSDATLDGNRDSVDEDARDAGPDAEIAHEGADGCGCRVGGTGRPSPAALAVTFALAFAWRRRRTIPPAASA